MEDKYNKYFNFRVKVIEQAKRDLIKYTDIYFEYEELKKGNAVEKLRFLIYPKQAKAHTLPESGETPPALTASAEIQSAAQAIRGFGVTEEEAIKLAGKYEHNYLLEVCKLAERYMQQQQVDNPAGRLIKAIKEGYFKDAIAEKIEKTAQKQALEQQQSEAEKAEQERKLKEAALVGELRKQYRSKELVEEVLEAQKEKMFYEAMRKKRAEE